jgi:RimJ/RimL family protein N-acetyltransferase
MEVTLKTMRPEDIPMVKPWLTTGENAKWLSPFFQTSSLRDEQLAFFLMRRDKANFLVLCDDKRVGLVGLTNIDDHNRSAEIWGVIGDPGFRRKGISTLSFVLLLQRAFGELNLHSVNAWAADGNFTIRIFEKLGFARIGCQRECHLQDGVLKNRILFDILRQDFETGPFAHRTGRI